MQPTPQLYDLRFLGVAGRVGDGQSITKTGKGNDQRKLAIIVFRKPGRPDQLMGCVNPKESGSSNDGYLPV